MNITDLSKSFADQAEVIERERKIAGEKDKLPAIYLRFPNEEQRRMFLEEILPDFKDMTDSIIDIEIKDLTRA